ncbi:GntR family transcriptional regulator [Micromonospora sp. NPDC047670]|uniref:GntR family transcriptional regulator n=1 Tax=Micromonospora sp. NPDC047670 TaxID=3364252 RepID=UPI00371DF2C2
MINPGSGVPAWRQLADAIRDRIARGAYPPGSRLPSETHLGQEFGLGRTTVRRAVAALRADGLVLVRHGWGTQVRPHPAKQEVAGEPGTRVSARMPTPDERALFGIPDGTPMLVVTGPDGLQDAYPADQYDYVHREP